MDIKKLQKVYKAFTIEDKRQGKDEDSDQSFIVCTNVAIWLRRHFFPTARIMGYSIEKNPTALVGAPTGGHDFLVVGDRYILDFWPRRVENDPFPIAYDLHTQLDLVIHNYGHPNNWEKFA